MHTDIHYSGPDASRAAVLDWVQWLGYKNAKLMARVAMYGTAGPNEPTLQRRWNHFNFFCSFAGVSGYPVREAFKRFAGITQEQLESIPE